MREYNEYRDKLCDITTAEYLKELGCDIFSPECFVQLEESGKIYDDYTGMIPEGARFYAYRYTCTYVQTWIRENYDVHIFIGWRPNIEKWDSHAYSLELSPSEYMKKRNMEAFCKDELFDTYEEALESGIKSALRELLKEEI